MEKELILNQARVQELGMEELKEVDGGIIYMLAINAVMTAAFCGAAIAGYKAGAAAAQR